MLYYYFTNTNNTVNTERGDNVISINLKSGVPIFEQIKEEFKHQILLGVWSPGEQLPSVRTLASELGINPNTIQRAYTELEREGVTYTVAGKGCFVEDDLTAIQMKKTAESFIELDGIIKSLKEQRIDKQQIINRVSEIYEEVNQ